MSPGALLATRLLSLSGKLRLAAEPFVRRSEGGPESVRDFVARRLGPEVAERLVEPFVGGVFAGDAARLSAPDAFPSLWQWEREKGSLLSGAIAAGRARRAQPPGPRLKGLLSFRDGLETLPRALARALGSAFVPRCAAEEIAPRAGGWVVRTPAGGVEADRVVVAAPAQAASALVAAFAPEAARALSAIPHPPLAVLHLAFAEDALRGRLQGFGHLVAPDPNRRILGAVWSSSLFRGRAPAGHALLTVFLGGSRDPRALELSDAGLVDAAARDLASEGLARGAPEAVLVTRWQRAIPQYEAGHGERIAALVDAERRWPGLRFVGNYRGGVSVGDVIRQAEAAAMESEPGSRTAG